MIRVSGNYRGMIQDKTCRVCGEKQETQEHILEECHKLMENENDKITTTDIFEEDIEHLRITAKRINNKS